jgi:hypothetical protein
MPERWGLFTTDLLKSVYIANGVSAAGRAHEEVQLAAPGQTTPGRREVWPLKKLGRRVASAKVFRDGRRHGVARARRWSRFDGRRNVDV